MDIKKKLLRVLKSGYQWEQAFIEELSDEQRAAAGEADQWAAKDEMSHIVMWKQRQARNLMARVHGMPQETFEDYLRINDEDFEVNRGLPWNDVIAGLEQGYALLVDSVKALSEEDLLAVEEDRGPLWRGIVGTGCTHPVMHITDYLFRHGETAKAVKIWSEAVAQLSELDDSDSWQGACRYNLACSFARSGQAERAVETLRQALILNPSLTEWSKEDSDLDTLRYRPDYKAIYAD